MNGTESEIDASDYFDYPKSEIDAGDINGRERNSNAKSQAKSKGGDGLSTGDIVLISLQRRSWLHSFSGCDGKPACINMTSSNGLLPIKILLCL